MIHRRLVPAAALLALSTLAACGGGGSGSALPASPALQNATPVPTAAPAASSSPAATAAPAAAPLGTAQLGGAPGFINAQSLTVYVFDADLAAPGTSTCNGACAAVWPAVTAKAGTTYPAPFSALKRADGTLQLAASGRPLYTYIADSGPGSIAGNGLTEFGGTWHIARPAGAAVPAASPTAAPSSTPTPAGYP